jgi:hypothetical protein
MLKFALYLILAAVEIHAAVQHVVRGAWGTGTIYRGHTGYVEISGFWMDLYPATVNVAANSVTVAGNPFHEGDTLYVYSTGRLPSPLHPAGVYAVKNLHGDTFQVWNSSESLYVFFQDEGAGVLQFSNRILKDGQPHEYVQSVSGLPPGVTCSIESADGRSFGTPPAARVWNSGEAIWVAITAASDAPLGPAEIRVVLRVSGYPDRSIDLPVTIADPLPVQLGRPASYPPIPSLKLWENSMTTLARQWCANPAAPTETYSFGVEQQAWYYDGAWVYYQIADYTKDPLWNNCGKNISDQYKAYVDSADGAPPAWRVFTDGLSRSAELWGGAYGNTIARMGVNGRYQLQGGFVRDDGIRETAYRLETAITYERVFASRLPTMLKSADLLIGMFDILFSQPNSQPTTNQLFFDGLALRSLIGYYDLTGDSRVPGLVKTALDWIWDRAWDNTQGMLRYNAYPYGPSCGTANFNSGNNYCVGGNHTWGTEMIPMVSPAYAWFWSITGDDTYRERADAMFAASAMDVTGIVDSATNTVTLAGHPYANGDEVSFRTPTYRALPSPVINTQHFFVRDATPDTFKVSLQKGGPAYRFASDGVVLFMLRYDITDKGKTFCQNYRWAFDFVRWRNAPPPARRPPSRLPPGTPIRRKGL